MKKQFKKISQKSLLRKIAKELKNSPVIISPDQHELTDDAKRDIEEYNRSMMPDEYDLELRVKRYEDKLDIINSVLEPSRKNFQKALLQYQNAKADKNITPQELEQKEQNYYLYMEKFNDLITDKYFIEKQLEDASNSLESGKYK